MKNFPTILNNINFFEGRHQEKESLLTQVWEPLMQGGGSQSGVPRAGARASPGNLSEIQMLRPHPKPLEAGTLGGASSKLGSNRLSGELACVLMFEKY